jgi:hypothetical protein
MVTETQSEQPHWITPLNTTTPRLEQGVRYDIQWQPPNSGVATRNYSMSKGLEIIPAKSFEVILAIPPYVVNNPVSPDGWGDWQFLVKYRIAAANEEHGNYILTAFFQMRRPLCRLAPFRRKGWDENRCGTTRSSTSCSRNSGRRRKSITFSITKASIRAAQLCI